MNKSSEHRPPPLCPLCGKNESPIWKGDRGDNLWVDFARHVYRNHVSVRASYLRTCPCGWHDNNAYGFDALAEHLRDHPDVTEHLVLAAIASVGRD